METDAEKLLLSFQLSTRTLLTRRPSATHPTLLALEWLDEHAVKANTPLMDRAL